MKINFQITGIDQKVFQHLFCWSDEALAEVGAQRRLVDEKPGFPCRVSLVDAEIGEEVLLLAFDHHPTSSPYQARGPVFIRKDAPDARLKINEIPVMLNHRLLSLRAYDEQGMMRGALTTQGVELEKNIQQLFCEQAVKYIHVHNASPGCYNCRIDRIN